MRDHALLCKDVLIIVSTCSLLIVQVPIVGSENEYGKSSDK